jgi:hypothetical protein
MAFGPVPHWGPGDHAKDDQPGGNRHGSLVLADSGGVAVTSMEETAEADVDCIANWEPLRQAGHRVCELGVTARSCSGRAGEIQGIITGDMVVEASAAGEDPQTVAIAEVAFLCWSPPSAHIPVMPVSGTQEGGNERGMLVTGDEGAAGKITGPDHARDRTGLHTADLAPAAPQMPSPGSAPFQRRRERRPRRPSARTTQCYCSHAA